MGGAAQLDEEDHAIDSVRRLFASGRACRLMTSLQRDARNSKTAAF